MPAMLIWCLPCLISRFEESSNRCWAPSPRHIETCHSTKAWIFVITHNSKHRVSLIHQKLQYCFQVEASMLNFKLPTRRQAGLTMTSEKKLIIMEQNSMAPREVKEACHRQRSACAMFRGTRRAAGADAQMAYSSNQHQFCEDLSQKNKEQSKHLAWDKISKRERREKEMAGMNREILDKTTKRRKRNHPKKERQGKPSSKILAHFNRWNDFIHPIQRRTHTVVNDGAFPHNTHWHWW